MRGLVCGQYTAIRVGRDDGDWTACNQYPQLLFSIAAGIALAFNLMKVFLCYAAVPAHLANKEARSRKGSEIEYVPGDPGPQIPRQVTKGFRKEGTQTSNGANLPAAQNTSNHQHGNQVQEAKQDLGNYPPVQERNSRNQDSRLEQYRSLVALEKQVVHMHPWCCAGENGVAA